MAKCMYCSELIESKGTKPKRYCSDRCRKAYKRRSEQTDSQSKRTQQTDKVKGGTCWCCGKDIEPVLVCCQECAWSGKAAAKRAGTYPPLLTDRTPDQMELDIVTAKPTGDYQLTDYEQEQYRPVSQLQAGEYNPVSKPGDEHYI